MTQNKVSIVRSHILSMLEDGKIKTGDKIPAAREIAEQLNISFLKVQQAVESLCQDGVLHSHSRKGTFVQPNWETRILSENICVYNPVEYLPWLPQMLELIEDSIPGLRSTFAFKRGTLEVRTTSHVLTEYHDYMDLSDIFAECYDDRSLFFEKPFRPFEINGKIVGIPFAFSPRVIFFNPKLFEKAGCKLPQPGWTWAEFTDCVKKLRKILPENQIINWYPGQHPFMTFIIRAGGKLFCPEEQDPVAIDSPEVKEGLRLFRELGDLVAGEPYTEEHFRQAFLSGQAAMHLSGRHYMDHIIRSDFDDWSTTPLPVFQGGVDCTAQATDLVCVRKSCTSPELAKKYITAMLSEKVQDYLGQWKHNIPIRKSSAFKSLDLDDPRDALFAVEVAKISTEFNLEPPFPGALVLKGITRILRDGIDLEEGLNELAQAARTILGIEGTGNNTGHIGSVFYRSK
ncbi:extracellular solute-binding protein [Rubellicoccus peritrichatus]|uniref:Extracellular solute-binding protein n=1 Tax=Rubellicoccus peritrichatus TaxID=3080537 RepID=A0AAQ3LCN7_9BACT|nr:extracellular solute-binding protein [Puniceicoccus sp. CR14]WOO43265.1 extracellular solute-binding protein [Puniceicoccus sp. CR14]